jgi:hypothetical protein
MVLNKEIEIVVGKFETHRVSYYHEVSPDITIIKVDGSEIFQSRTMNGSSPKMRIENGGKIDQWFYSFIVGTQETHVIEIHVRKSKPSRKGNGIHYEYNILVDGAVRIREGKKLDPHRSGTRNDVILETMSREYFHILSEIEKKLYARDILKNPNWRMDWVYVQ